MDSNLKNQNSKRKSWLISTRPGFICLASAILFAVISFVIYERTAGLAGSGWKKTEGTVEGRNVRSQMFMQVADTKYAYTVDEQTYHQIYTSFSDGWALKEGAVVKVLYNPEQPMQSRLDLGFSLDILLLSLLDVTAIAGVVLTVKHHRQKVRMEETSTGFIDFEPHYEIESSN